jgi:uncharacterized membrane protein
MTAIPVPPLAPSSRRGGIIMGAGMGGFVDGIALHQLAHWHNMGSSALPPTTMDALERNMVWDGLFHVMTWVLTLIGVYLLVLDARRGRPVPSPRAFTGQLILGWGIFNLVEGLIDHHLLNLHHVRDLPVHVPVYDWIFLLVAGIGFIAIGWAMAKESAYATARSA